MAHVGALALIKEWIAHAQQNSSRCHSTKFGIDRINREYGGVDKFLELLGTMSEKVSSTAAQLDNKTHLVGILCELLKKCHGLLAFLWYFKRYVKPMLQDFKGAIRKYFQRLRDPRGMLSYCQYDRCCPDHGTSACQCNPSFDGPLKTRTVKVVSPGVPSETLPSTSCLMVPGSRFPGLLQRVCLSSIAEEGHFEFKDDEVKYENGLLYVPFRKHQYEERVFKLPLSSACGAAAAGFELVTHDRGNGSGSSSSNCGSTMRTSEYEQGRHFHGAASA